MMTIEVTRMLEGVAKTPITPSAIPHPVPVCLARWPGELARDKAQQEGGGGHCGWRTTKFFTT